MNQALSSLFPVQREIGRCNGMVGGRNEMILTLRVFQFHGGGGGKWKVFVGIFMVLGVL